MVMLAVDGVPCVTGSTPWLTPSSMKLTVPDGGSAPVPAFKDVMVAVR